MAIFNSYVELPGGNIFQDGYCTTNQWYDDVYDVYDADFLPGFPWWILMIWAVLICSMGCLSPQSGAPFAIAKLVNITQRTMVYGTQKTTLTAWGL